MTPVPALNLTELLKDLPRGAWVAISRVVPARVLAVGSDIRKVQEEAIASGEKDPLIVRVPETLALVML